MSCVSVTLAASTCLSYLKMAGRHGEVCIFWLGWRHSLRTHGSRPWIPSVLCPLYPLKPNGSFFSQTLLHILTHEQFSSCRRPKSCVRRVQAEKAGSQQSWAQHAAGSMVQRAGPRATTFQPCQPRRWGSHSYVNNVKELPQRR